MADLQTLNNYNQTGTFHKKAGQGIRNSTFEFGVRALPMLSYWPASIYSTYIPGIIIVSFDTGVLLWYRHRMSTGYSVTSITTPAPTVRPPSRIANRSSLSIAIGCINSTSTSTLSPGITISTPEGNVTDPVTSVVRK